MLNNNSQKQISGNNCINIQTEGNITVITPQNAKAELLQIFIDNFPTLRNMAKEIVEERVDLITTSFINKMNEQEETVIKNLMDRLSQPDMQYTFYEAQKTYAKSGDPNKLNTLIELLIEKGKENPESLKDFLLDDAIEKLSKISLEQLNLLSFITLTKVTYPFTNRAQFYEDYLKELFRYSDSLNLPKQNIDYLCQMGCLNKTSFNNTEHPLLRNIKDSYKSLFAKGFTKENFLKEIKDEKFLKYTMQCLDNESLLQIKYLQKEDLDNDLNNDNASKDQKKIIHKYFNLILSDNEIISILSNLDKNLKTLIEEKNLVNNVYLTPLGILLGIKNIEIQTGEKINWEF